MSVNEEEGADGDETGVDRPMDKRQAAGNFFTCIAQCTTSTSLYNCIHSKIKLSLRSPLPPLIL